MIAADEVEQLIGAVVVDRANDRIGEVRQVIAAPDVREPGWVGVRADLNGADVLVPLEGAEWDATALHTAVVRSTADHAPEIDFDEPLTTEGQERLLTHYGIPCVRSEREPVIVSAYGDADVSYSVAATDAEATTEGVSGHMLLPATPTSGPAL